MSNKFEWANGYICIYEILIFLTSLKDTRTFYQSLQNLDFYILGMAFFLFKVKHIDF